jgi:hypothetical protein
MSKYFKR